MKRVERIDKKEDFLIRGFGGDGVKDLTCLIDFHERINPANSIVH